MTHIIFDSYNKHSIKYHERQRRAKGTTTKEYQLDKDNTILPSQAIIMKCDKNKTALIKYLCSVENAVGNLKLIGVNSEFSHEEADVKILSYLLKLSAVKKNTYRYWPMTLTYLSSLYFSSGIISMKHMLL